MTLLPAIFTALLLAIATPDPDPPAPPTPPAQPAANASEPIKNDLLDLDPWARLAAPEIERLTARSFTKLPPIRVVSEDDLATTLAKPMREAMIRMRANVKRDGTPMSDLEMTVRTRSQAYRVAARTLGLYDHDQKVILVIPQTAERLGKKRAWSPETIRRITRLALAHELVHALQDQTADLAVRLDALSGEPEKCLMAVSEGHAVVVTDALAETLGWSTANMVLNGLVTGVEEPAPGTTPGTPPPPPIDLHGSPSASVYQSGAAFVRHHAGTSLPKAWSLLASPPKAWADVLDPKRFAPPALDPADSQAKPNSEPATTP